MGVRAPRRCRSTSVCNERGCLARRESKTTHDIAKDQASNAAQLCLPLSLVRVSWTYTPLNPHAISCVHEPENQNSTIRLNPCPNRTAAAASGAIDESLSSPLPE